MKQYRFENNSLILNVKKSPFLIRISLFIISGLLFIAPIAGMLSIVSSGGDFHIGFIIGIGFFGFLGFRLLRSALWNSYGQEVIVFDEEKIHYEADYRWFKDAKTEIERVPSDLYFSQNSVGYEEDQKGILVIQSNTNYIECVTHMPLKDLEKLTQELENRYA